MYIKKTKYYLALLCCIGMLTVKAQDNTVSSGKNATGSGGTVSYSVGQAFYLTSSNSNGSIAQGVQQPIEIQVVLGVEERDINLYATVYPNPTSDIVNLTIGNTDTTNLSYQLYDYNGRVLTNGIIKNKKTSITISRYPQATYLLSVTKNNKTIKTFKILKK